MEATQVTCPNCHSPFALSAAIEQPIIDRLQAQFAQAAAKRDAALQLREQDLVAKQEQLKQSQTQLQAQIESQVASKLSEQRKQLAIEMEQKATQAVSTQLEDLNQQMAEKDKQLKIAQQQQLDLIKQKRELASAKASFELEKATQIDAERKQIAETATKIARDSIEKELLQMQQVVAIHAQKLAEAQEAELKIRKQKLEWEAEKQTFDLQLARQIDEVKQNVSKDKDEEFRLREAEKNKQLEDLRRQTDELRRKLDQGSQQNQGEVLELDLESSLRRCFSADEILPVAKGVLGADLLHKVCDEFGRECGTIIWELKRTKTWSDLWLTKLKDDKLAAKAQMSVLISVTMPKEVASFECRENVWIAPPNLAVALAAVLRTSLIETAAARRAAENRHDKMAAVYDYLAGFEFKHRVTAIFESFTAMKKDLETEKRAMQKIWAAREKQIERVLANTVGLHGDLQGIIGNTLPAIESMELSSLTDEAQRNSNGTSALPAETSHSI